MESKQKNYKLIFIIFAFIFLTVYFCVSSVLQLKSYNFMTKLALINKQASDGIVLVMIDDKSLQEIGRWPWKREYYAEIFDYFENHTKAKLVGYDGLIVAPDTEHLESDRKFFSKVKDFKKLTAGIAYSYDEFPKGTKTVALDELLSNKTDIRVIDKRNKKRTSQEEGLKSYTILQNEYFKNINSLGAVVIPTDSDGYIRKASQLISYKDGFYPSLALSMYEKYSGVKDFILTDKYLWGFSDNLTLKIPIENQGGFASSHICFYKTKDGVYSHKKYSASDIINSYRAIKKGETPIINPDVFENKVVFVGANANAQALADTARTPVGENFSGLDLQATSFDNLVNNNFFKMISPYYNFLICVVIFILVFVLAGILPVTQALLASVCVMFAYLLFAFIMYYNKIAVGLILPEVYVLIALLCTYSYRYLVEGAKKEKMQKAMGKYLSYDVMQNVVENIDHIELGGKREDISVLFADIRNFTSLSETLDADSVTNILNEYFSVIVPIVEEHNGILNKFMGDAVLVIFGSTNKKTKNHALDAVKCASKMLKKVKYLQEKWIDEGKPKIEMGIGISSGEAFVGNIGSVDRLEYTVIGDTVNTASRIENYNKVYRTNFLISESTFRRVENLVDAIAIKDVAIRGKAQKVTLYEIIRLVGQ